MGRIDNAAVLVCACLHESDRVLRLCTVKVRKILIRVVLI